MSVATLAVIDKSGARCRVPPMEMFGLKEMAKQQAEYVGNETS